MAKIKFTKGELKKQRDALRQFQRYLPTLQLKKQQLQLEILRQIAILDEKNRLLNKKEQEACTWAGILHDPLADVSSFVKLTEVETRVINVAGVDVIIFAQARFPAAEYDLFTTPLWVDAGIEALRELASLKE